MDEKSYKNILIYGTLYKTFIDAKPLLIMFNKVDGCIRVCNRTRYLVLFGPEKYAIYNSVRYLVSQKSVITIILYCHSLLLEKTLTLHFIILIKSTFNKNQDHCYYNIFLEKCLYQLANKERKNFFF